MPLHKSHLKTEQAYDYSYDNQDMISRQQAVLTDDLPSWFTEQISKYSEDLCKIY